MTTEIPKESEAPKKWTREDFVEMGYSRANRMIEAAFTDTATPEQFGNTCIIAESIATRTLGFLIFNVSMNRNNHKYSPTIAQALLSEISDKVYEQVTSLRKAHEDGSAVFYELKKEH